MSKGSLDRIRAITAAIEDRDREIGLAEAELDMLTHIDDDAQRDASVSEHAEDRQAARMTASDVKRARRNVDKLVAERSKLVRKRAKAIDKLAAR
jgi:iron uptake system EfeUOB component EfeO/EfeM